MVGDAAWYAVRTICRLHEDVVEERITLWNAVDRDEACRMGEREAIRYAGEVGGTDTGLVHVVHLFEEPGHGSEAFSARHEGGPAVLDLRDAVPDLTAAGRTSLLS